MGSMEAAIARCGAGGVPKSPHGRITSTMAMTMNSATSVSFENEKTVPKMCASPMPMHHALTTLMITAAT